MWAEFRGACDAFFNARDEANQSAEKDREHNLTLKLALVQRINELEIPDRSEALKMLRSLAAEFSELGQVPLAKKDEIYTAYKGALDAKYGSLALSAKEKEDMAFNAKIDSIQASPERNKLLQKERFDIRKQIERIEQEANRMETNLSFFARSKGADSLRNEVENKIKDMQQQVSKLKTKLKQLPNE